MSATTINLTPATQAGLDLEQYFGLWAVAEEQFMNIFNRVGQLNLAAHIEANAGRPVAAAVMPATKARTADVVIGLVDINGTLMKRGTSLSSSSSLIQVRQVIRQSARDPEIDAILLRADSPGGTLAGTEEVAEEVQRARQQKPVFAFVEDLAASAMYWIASQAEKVYANTPTALIGSVGTFIGLYDYSGAAAQQGIKAIVIKAGKLKGAGFPGTEITAEQQAYWQEIVDKAQAQFTAAVARGRGLTAKAVAEQYVTGRVYLAQDAIEMGMIDGVKSFDAVVAELTERVRRGPARSSGSKGMKAMSNEHEQPRAASISELEAACPGASADFLLSQVKTAATLETAQRAFIAEQQRRLEAAEKTAAEAKAKAEAEAKVAAAAKAEAEAAKKAPGVETLGSGGQTKAAEGDAVAQWNEAVAANFTGGRTKAQAIAKTVHDHPELHQAYLDAIKAGRR